MAKKLTKKASSRKTRTVRSKRKVAKDSKSKKPKAKTSKKAKPVKAKSTRAKSAKRAKPSAKKSKRTEPAKMVLASLSTGAGVKLNAKVGSAAPASKVASSRKIRRKSSPLTAVQLQEFRELLLQRRNELLSSVSRMRAEALDKNRQDAAGNLSKFPTNPADLGSDNYELEFTLSLLEGERELLREIDDALKRIERGIYGICEGTGEAIPRIRLKFEPWTRYTVEYAGLLEKGLVHPEESAESDGWDGQTEGQTEKISG